MISVAAELADMHPQTLRMYETRGLIEPQRSAKNTRLYSQRDFGFHLEDDFDPGQVEAGRGEVLDVAQALDVALRVEARVLRRALRLDQPARLVHAQRLRVHVGELGGDRDHEDAALVVDRDLDPFAPHGHSPPPPFRCSLPAYNRGKEQWKVIWRWPFAAGRRGGRRRSWPRPGRRPPSAAPRSAPSGPRSRAGSGCRRGRLEIEVPKELTEEQQ